jgi:DHA2 family multidrug resistance protein
MLRKLDPRLLLAAGLTCTAFAVYLNAQYTTAWSAANYYRTELLMGIGQSVSLIGLVGCIILQGVFSGGLTKPQWILTFSAMFHTIRLFGGTAGAIYMAHFLAEREKLHSNLLWLHVTQGSWITDANLHALAAGVYTKSSGAAAAAARAADLIAARLRLQAYALSLIDGFLLVAWACFLGLLLTALLRKSPLNYGDLSAVQQELSTPQEPKS